MTMVPCENVATTKHKHPKAQISSPYGGFGGNIIYYCEEEEEDEEESKSDLVIGPMSDQKAAASEEEEEESWLQLSIGSGSGIIRQSQVHAPNMVELDLLPRPSTSFEHSSTSFVVPRPRALLIANNTQSPSSSPLMYYQQYYHPGFPLETWPGGLIRPPPPSSSSSSSLMQLHRQFQQPPPPWSPMHMVQLAGVGGFRVVSPPPRRPHSGIWFALQPSQNQTKEPFLPQISKSYLRIKDGRMTVGLVIKYLVNKLRLESESEIEITCRGQQLQPLMTLQHVRDNIWGPTLTLLQDSSTTSVTDHLMLLLYSRSS